MRYIKKRYNKELENLVKKINERFMNFRKKIKNYLTENLSKFEFKNLEGNLPKFEIKDLEGNLSEDKNLKKNIKSDLKIFNVLEEIDVNCFFNDKIKHRSNNSIYNEDFKKFACNMNHKIKDKYEEKLIKENKS